MIIRALLLFLLFFYSPPARANEILYFKEPANHKERLVTEFAGKESKEKSNAYLIAKSDLNNDAIDEYIIKPQTCTKNSFCPHSIVALHKYQPISIGSFKAYKIIIKNSHDYGVRRLQVYNNPNNNFTHATANWNPFLSQYEIKKK